jgi:hypothetical protein
MKIWAEVPKFDFGISTTALTIAAAAMGAVQAAAVAAAPLPKAKRGGLIKGKAHEHGGEIIEAEGGEFIINKIAAAKNIDSLRAINAGILPKQQPGDGGFAMREYQRVNKITAGDYEKLAEKFAQKIAELKIYTAIEDINDGQKNFALLQNNSAL